MNAHHHRRTNCRLCQGVKLSHVFSLAPTPPANAFVDGIGLKLAQPVFPLDLFFCENCAHLQLLDVVDPDLLFHNYVYVSGTSPTYVKHFEDYAADCITQFALATGDLAVDIGSNDGTLLGFFQDCGLEILGIDPAKKIAAQASNNGIETWPMYFDADTASEIHAQKGPASIVTANNMFAHADDLVGITDAIRAMLAGDGVFVFEVSYLAEVFKKTLFDTIYHEHLAYHSVQPLEEFFIARGMELISVVTVPSHGGSIRGVVQLEAGPHQSDGSVDSLIEQERKLKIDRAETWAGYGEKIEVIGGELRALLSELKQAGNSIAGFGAPAKATTLMYQFGIGADIIDFIVDDSPLKQGLYTPGKHIPVVPAREIYGRMPDYLLILAWNFAESIITNHAEFRNQGGHFIVPLPTVEVF